MNYLKFKHWTPRYIFNKVCVIIFEKLNPDLPWLTKKSIEFIKKYIKKNHKMLEVGSGRSTLWFQYRVKYLISLEHNKQWFDKVNKMISKNTKLILKENLEDYVMFINQLDEDYFDIVLIDGLERGKTLLASYSKVKKGGLIIFDDAHAYLHNPTTYSPYAAKKPINTDYIKVNKLIKNDNKIWTSNGLKDTLIIIKK